MSAAEKAPRTHLRHDGYLGIFALDADRGWGAIHVTVKRGFALVPDGLMVPAPLQQVCFVDDRRFEEAPPFVGSVRYESDLGPPKPVCDVVVEASCHPPGGQATRCDVAVTVAEEDPVRLTVVGDRVAMVDPDGRVRFTPATPFSVRPLRYEWAYGGADRQTAMPIMCPANPVGTGFLMKPGPGVERGWHQVVMPSIEPYGGLMTQEDFLAPSDPDLARPPAGFGWIDRQWTPRLKQAGMPPQMDGFWSLLFPDARSAGGYRRDRDASYWNGAPRRLQVPLEGFERVVFEHMHPEHARLQVQLPITTPRLRARIGEDEPVDVALTLCTVHFELEREQATLCWRGTIERPAADPEAPAAVRLKVDGRALPPPETTTDTAFDPLEPPRVQVGGA